MCLEGRHFKSIVLKYLKSKENLLLRKQCAFENGSSHLFTIYTHFGITQFKQPFF